MKLLTSVLLFGLASASLACSENVWDTHMEDLRHHRALWAARGSENYQLTYTRSCFCPPECTRKIVIEVSAGEVTETRDAETDILITPLLPCHEVTVQDLFELAILEIDTKAYALRIDYDETLGYPCRIETRSPPRTTDGGLRVIAEVALIP